MTWALPAPALSSPAENSTLATLNRRSLTQPVFTWSYGDTHGVDFFRLCIAKPGAACSARPVVQQEAMTVDLVASTSTTITQDLSPFMGQALTWSVAACNAALGCAYPPARRLQVPILVGTFDAIYQVTQNDKCLNCHEMHKENATYLRHISLGRFTREEFPAKDIGDLDTDKTKCRTCHSAATGFLDHWGAPGRRGTRIKREPMSNETCHGLQEVSVMHPLGIPHLKTAPDILWAVDRIPDLGTVGWLELINAWKFSCPCDQRTRTKCDLRGQFIP